MGTISYEVLTSDRSFTDAATYVTAPIDYGTKPVLLIAEGAHADPATGPTPNSTAMVWSLVRAEQTANGSVRRSLAIWLGIPDSVQTGQVINIIYPATQSNCQWHVLEMTDVPLTATIVQSAFVAASTFGAVLATLASFASTDNGTFFAFAMANTTSTITAADSLIEIEQTTTAGDTADACRLFTGAQVTNDTTPTVTVSGTTNRNVVGIALEVKFAAQDQSLAQATRLDAPVSFYSPVVTGAAGTSPTVTLLGSGTDFADSSSYSIPAFDYSPAKSYALVVGSAETAASASLAVPVTSGVDWETRVTRITDNTGTIRRLTILQGVPSAGVNASTVVGFAAAQVHIHWALFEIANAHLTSFAFQASEAFGNDFGPISAPFVAAFNSAANIAFAAAIMNNTTSTLTAGELFTGLTSSSTGPDPGGLGDRMITEVFYGPNLSPDADISGTTNRRWAVVALEVIFVAQAQVLTPALLSAAPTFYSPEVFAEQDAEYQGYVGVGYGTTDANTLTQATRLDATVTFYDPSVGQSLVAPLLSVPVSVYAPSSVFLGDQVSLSPARLDVGVTIYDPNVTPGPLLFPATMNAEVVVYTPSVANELFIPPEVVETTDGIEDRDDRATRGGVAVL